MPLKINPRDPRVPASSEVSSLLWVSGACGVNLISTDELRMTQDEPLAQQLIALGALLNEVEARLARAPAAPAGLEDLKNSVDSLRTSMWAVLAAGYGATAPLRVERLKLRRAIESLRGVQAGLEKQIRHPEHAELQSLALAIADQIGPTVGGK